MFNHTFDVKVSIYRTVKAFTTAAIAELIVGDSGHALTSMARSGSWMRFVASRASDFASPPTEIGFFGTISLCIRILSGLLATGMFSV
jgi:hypothetical protein